MTLLIVIVNYRVSLLTIDCLHSLAAEIGSVPGMRVAVCENGSGDDSADRIRSAILENNWGSWCTLTVSASNLGFTGGNNIVLRPALESDDPPQYALLLNPDTVVRPGALKTLVDFMDRHPDVGIAGPRLEEPDGTPQCSAFRFHTPLSEFERSISLGLVTRLLKQRMVAPPPPQKTSEADWVSGAAMIIRRDVFNEIGVLDEGYFTYFEDTDFCFNARKVGWCICCTPESRVVHLGGQSGGVGNDGRKRAPVFMFEARRRYFLKNRGVLCAVLADAALIAGVVLWRLRVLFGKPDSKAPFLLRDAVAHSVFAKGFALKDVQNPALAQTKPNVKTLQAVSVL